MLSGDGAQIEIARDEIPAHAASLSVRIDGQRVAAPHAVVSSASEARKVTLQFLWPEEEAKLAFWQQLYLERPRRPARPQTSRGMRWTEDLK
jgi:hypothetical protein